MINDFDGMLEAGKALKATKGWIEDGNGTNSSGFNALPAAYRISGGTFEGLSKLAYFWSSSSSTNRSIRSIGIE